MLISEIIMNLIKKLLIIFCLLIFSIIKVDKNQIDLKHSLMLDLSVIVIQNLILIMYQQNSPPRKILLLEISIHSKPHLIILIEYK
jgi:hypothetical protein